MECKDCKIYIDNKGTSIACSWLCPFMDLKMEPIKKYKIKVKINKIQKGTFNIKEV